MTAGRLLFAPVVQKLGARRSIALFGGVGTAMFVAGCLLGSSGILILGCSGFAISIIYPTMVLLIQQIYPVSCAATKTGSIMSLATLADIAFNMVFGAIVGMVGYRMGFLILPVCMAAFYLLYGNLVRQVSAQGAENA
jgi:MFS family permease